MRVRAYIPGQRFREHNLRFTDLVASMFSHVFVRRFVRSAAVNLQACQRSRSPGALWPDSEARPG